MSATINAFDRIINKARENPLKIALAEGSDSRVVEAAVRASKEGIAQPVLIGDRVAIEAQLQAIGADIKSLEISDPLTSDQAERYADAYYELRKHKGVTPDKAKASARRALNYAALMVHCKDAHGCIGGAVETTAATVRAALQVIGVAPGVETVSSFFLLFSDENSPITTQPLMFSDCALVITPDAKQLSDIACTSSDSYTALIGETSRTAMLSFSTAGSGSHKTVAVVKEGTALANAARPDLLIDGEIQFDAAFVESVATRKAPDSPLEGSANVFVFPNLDAGNIGYKIAQRLGGMKAIGPILQGLNQPANDLSRGCSADDVYALLAVTCVQAASMQE